jgi:hypothetical protein
MAMIVVQLPRGRKAVMQCDDRTGRISTDHAGLRAAFFDEGVRDWTGRRLGPMDGAAFLSAVYDRLFLCGYVVQWLPGASEAERPPDQWREDRGRRWPHSPPGCPGE